jgi:hypothetical protein
MRSAENPIFHKHQKRENFDIFIQLWSGDEDEESVPIPDSSEKSNI